MQPCDLHLQQCSETHLANLCFQILGSIGSEILIPRREILLPGAIARIPLILKLRLFPAQSFQSFVPRHQQSGESYLPVREKEF